MSRYISDSFRNTVVQRAQNRCEYCRLHAHNSFFTFHIDHIISLKHGGATVLENLAFACQICNLNKGTDIATILEGEKNPIRFFNPRTDIWEEHFLADNTGFLVAQSSLAEATIKVLDLNHPESIIERREMIRLNVF